MIEGVTVAGEYAAVGLWWHAFVLWYARGLVALYEMWRDRDAYIPEFGSDDVAGADRVVHSAGVYAGGAGIDARDGAAVVAVA